MSEKGSLFLRFLICSVACMHIISCSSEKGAEIIDHKGKIYSRNGVQSVNGQESKVVVSEQKSSGYRPIYSTNTDGKQSTMGYFYTKKTTTTQRTYEGPTTSHEKQSGSSWGSDQEISETKLYDIDNEKQVGGSLASEAVSPTSSRSPEVVSGENNSTNASMSKEYKEYKVVSPLNLNNFEWPLHGKILTRYGNHGRKFNDGINISAPEGTPVLAASDGKIAYIGNNVEGYGNLIIIKHNDNIMTAYAHLGEIRAERGAQVKKGEAIGNVGTSGNVSQPQLHFSVRKGKKTIDPEINNG